MPNMLSPRDLVSRPDNMDKTALHTFILELGALVAPRPLPKGKVKSMQRSGTEAIRTQIQQSKRKREITNITNSQNTKENI